MSISSASNHRTITPSVLYFGTPVCVISSENPDGSTNLAPISSYWALGDHIVLGIDAGGRTVPNLLSRPEIVVGFPDETQWEPVQRLGQLTGEYPIPAGKPDDTWYEPDKFAAVGWHRMPATTVRPERAAELPVHLEARVENTQISDDGLAIVHARCSAVHVIDELVIDGTHHIDTLRWRPLIYTFQHFFGLGERRGIPPWALNQR
ncbi:flavin reductase family protein [Leucobacter sp. CSA2]|uniref:Flavin reductase family protein n=1 Tax=Leucobacter edaphi TaxID=2796472 RepID=A0A934QB42_9MICO|nr:flavin reductase family protein [Leucobacter edaphi]MBK0421439.1 flavin reductase family protein [Leucobacter edaphi]